MNASCSSQKSRCKASVRASRPVNPKGSASSQAAFTASARKTKSAGLKWMTSQRRPSSHASRIVRFSALPSARRTRSCSLSTAAATAASASSPRRDAQKPYPRPTARPTMTPMKPRTAALIGQLQHSRAATERTRDLRVASAEEDGRKIPQIQSATRLGLSRTQPASARSHPPFGKGLKRLPRFHVAQGVLWPVSGSSRISGFPSYCGRGVWTPSRDRLSVHGGAGAAVKSRGRRGQPPP